MRIRDELRQEVEARQDRVFRLSEVGVCVSESLDVATVMAEVAERACGLTGVRYGAMMTVDDSGQPGDWVLSDLTGGERRSLLEWPDGRHLFEDFRDLPRMLRFPTWSPAPPRTAFPPTRQL